MIAFGARCEAAVPALSRFLLLSLQLLCLHSLDTAASHAEAPRPALPSVDLVRAIEAAPRVVVGEVAAVESHPPNAYQAALEVERTLVGPATGDALVVAWDERAPSRPARLVRGDRVLLALEPLVVTSSWAERPGPAPDADAVRWTIAAGAGAFLRAPSVDDLAILEHFLALPAAARNGPDGVRHLLALAAQSQAVLSRSAARRLLSTGPEPALAPRVAALAVAALRRPASTGIPTAIVDWVAHAQPGGLRDALDAALGEPAVAPGVILARSRLGGGASERLAGFADDPRPEIRAAVADGTTDEDLLGRLIEDPEAGVREAAARRLAVVDPASPNFGALLGDADRSVRAAAARTVASRGDAAVAMLERIVSEADSPARETALTTLARIGTDTARHAIAGLARDHPDAGIRELARIALERAIGDVHHAEP